MFYLYDDDDHAIGEVDGASGLVTRAYGFGPNGLVQRYYADLQKYTTYCWDVNGNLANRARSNDLTVLTDSTPLYDGFGQLYLDADTQSGGIYPPVDPIGAGGQFGHLTDEELRGNGSQTGLRLLGRNLYDGSKGHFLARAQGGFNEYDAAQLPYQVFTGIAKGIANGLWQSVAGDLPTLALALTGTDASSPQAQAIVERFYNPWTVGDSRAEKAAAIFGGFATEAGQAFFAGTGAIRAAGASLKEDGCFVFNCFPAGTLVATAADASSNQADKVSGNGVNKKEESGTEAVKYVGIEALCVGDVVASRGEQTGTTEYKRIVAVTKKSAKSLVTVHLSDAHTG